MNQVTLNLAECFFQQAEKQPNHPLILRQEAGDNISYAEFSADIQALAQQLKDTGIKPGDNIGIHYPSGGYYIAFVYAVWFCGACVTPLPLELTPAEKQQIFEYVHIDAVISHSRMTTQVSANLHGDSTPLLHQAVITQAQSLCNTPAELVTVNPAFIRFTSGTTGNAKGVVLSHEAIYERIHAANKVLNINEQDRILWLLSMDYHFAVSIVAYLTFGASIVLPKNSFGVTLLNAANQHNATFIYGSPTHYMLMVQDDNGIELPHSLRVAIVTTTALSADAANAFYQRFNWVLNETYGIIELGLPAINISQSRAKQGSVGRITPDYELRLEIIDQHDYGEITVRSKGMLDAYYSPWRSRETILAEQGGWFHTGDLGKLDADGFLYIVGRSKEMISVGGMKFFPEEVETVLEKHPTIAAAAVFGVKDRQWGEPAQAHLVLAEGAERPADSELRSYCKQSLTTHKVPSRFIWVEQLTYTASGKKIRNPNKLHPIN
jgi:long-chain acyl-CoA synthetase